MNENGRRRISLITLIVITQFAFGTVGYIVIEGWTLVDAFYMTTITLATVGYGEIHPLSNAGRLFTSFLILTGVSTVAFGVSLLVERLLISQLGGGFRRRRMQRMLNSMNQHVIVCGYGRVGRNAVKVLRQEERRQVLVIENDPELAEEVSSQSIHVLHGDATNDDLLRQAGIERAWGLIVATGQDSVNLFVVLSARALNRNLTIVARSTDPLNEAKMKRAGADRVVSPYHIGGQRMAHSLMRPHLTEFLDVLTTDGGQQMWLEELHVSEGSVLVSKTVAEIDMRRKSGVTLLGILRQTTGEVLTPDGTTRLQVDDDLIVIGTREQLDQLEQLVS